MQLHTTKNVRGPRFWLSAVVDGTEAEGAGVSFSPGKHHKIVSKEEWRQYLVL